MTRSEKEKRGQKVMEKKHGEKEDNAETRMKRKTRRQR